MWSHWSDARQALAATRRSSGRVCVPMLAPLDALVAQMMTQRPYAPLGVSSGSWTEDVLLAFEQRYMAVAKPFDRTYTRDDLIRLLARLTKNRTA